MTILAQYQSKTVEVLDAWSDGAGTKFASVKALDGSKPFVGGDKWPVRSEWGTVKTADLQNVRQDPQAAPAAPNLLDMALAAARQQWPSGETVWVYERKAFLKEQQGFVELCIVGKQASCKIFWLNPDTWSWEPVHNLNTRYSQWVEKVRGAK